MLESKDVSFWNQKQGIARRLGLASGQHIENSVCSLLNMLRRPVILTLRPPLPLGRALQVTSGGNLWVAPEGTNGQE
jgi:hypothetical protein